MIRQSLKTREAIIADMPRWYAASWKRIRDARILEARCITEQLTRSVLVRVARRANHEFVKYMREVRA